MKNFKLLLATTAILSTTALMANAITGESEKVDIKAELIKARSLENIQPLDFGRIVFEDGTTSLTANMDSSGNVSISGGEAYVLTQGKMGIVTGATCEKLSYPTGTISLTIPDGGSVVSTVTNLTCITDGETSKFYANFRSNNFTSGGIPAGIYTGSFTVTAIYPEENGG